MENLINERIELIMFKERLSQKDLAEKLDIASSSMNKLVSGATKPSADTIISLMNEFNINANWLLTGKGTMYNEIENKVEGIVSDSGVGYVRTLKKTENSTSTMELLQQLKSENELLRDQVRAWQSGLITRNVIS